MGAPKLLVLALIFTGCGGEASAAPLRGSVTYGKSGGIAGLVQTLTVQPGGRAVAASAERKRSFRLSRAKLKSLTAAVAKADLAHVKSAKPGPGADAFTYSVGYRGHRVRWDDFGDDPPPRVLRLYRLLDDLYERHSPCPDDGRSC
jgi:hypothetical protein